MRCATRTLMLHLHTVTHKSTHRPFCACNKLQPLLTGKPSLNNLGVLSAAQKKHLDRRPPAESHVTRESPCGFRSSRVAKGLGGVGTGGKAGPYSIFTSVAPASANVPRADGAHYHSEAKE